MIQEIPDPQLLLALAKVTAILIAAFAVASLIKRPGLRASFWTASILMLPFVFVSSFSFSVLKVIPQEREVTPIVQPAVTPVVLTPFEPSGVSEAVADHPVAVPQEVPIPSVEINEEPRIETNSEPSISWALIGYLSGVLIALIPWMISTVKLWRLKKTPSTGRPLGVWQNLISRIPLKAELKFTPSSSAPFASGILKPSILIPHDSAGWSQRRIQSTLLHEAAHLKRRDPLTRFLSSLVKALFWFHPLVWLAHRQLIAAQEQACDQFALIHGVAPTDYAEDLLQSASRSHTTPTEALAMARWSQIGNRIRHILNSQNHRPTTMTQIMTLCCFVALASLAVTSIGFALEKNDVAAAESFLSKEESSTLDIIENLRGKYLPKHPLLNEQQSKISELKVYLADGGKSSWQLTTGPHHFGKGEVPGELSRLLKLVPDLTVRINAREEDRFEDLSSLMESLRKAGARNLSVTMGGEPKIGANREGLQHAVTVVQFHPSLVSPDSVTADYMRDEFAKIVAEGTLRAASQALQDEFNSSNEALDYMKNNLTTRPVRGTDLIEIHAYHKDRSVAVLIANAVAEAYEKRQNTAAKFRAKTEMTALDEEVEMQYQLVEKYRKELVSLTEKHGIEVESIMVLIQKKQADLAKLNTPKGVTWFAPALQIQRPVNQVPKYYKDYQAALERADLLVRGGLGSRHPEVVAAREQVNRTFKYLEEEKLALIGLLKDELANLNKMKSLSKIPEDVQIQHRIAQENYEKSKLMLQEMKLKQQEQRVLLKMPRTSVTIHEIAK